jgi:hypothetical protein
MTDFGTSMAVQIAADVGLKCIEIGWHVIHNAKLYIHEEHEFRLRLRAQVGIWEAISGKLEETEIKERMRPADIVTYYDIMERLHSLMRNYVAIKCKVGKEKEALLGKTSTKDLRRRWEQADILKPLTVEQKKQSMGFWLRLIEEAAWAVWRKEKSEKLVTEIERWGLVLDRFSSHTFPAMFPEPTKENIAMIADHRLDQTNAKAQVMLAKSTDTTTTAIQGLSLAEQGTFILGRDRITFTNGGFIRPPIPGPQITAHEVEIERERRSDLGGVERRQWVKFKGADGNTTDAIIEFKACPCHDDARYSLGKESLTKEIASLIRTLRTAAQSAEIFHVLHCEGWYEAYDHFGLVYRLPPGGKELKCESLGNILLKKEYKDLLQRDLENRLLLAKALAWTLFQLHSVNWVHEKINADNILLFGKEGEGDKVHFDWSSPYLVGFDSSRSTTGLSGKLDFRGQWTTRLYTHPDRQLTYERYRKIHDIYSLGVVLLEVGRLGSFIEEPKGEKLNKTPYQLKEMFVDEAMSLKTVLGKAYTEIVLTCLNGNFTDRDDDYLLSGEYRTNVCEKLDLIKIS